MHVRRHGASLAVVALQPSAVRPGPTLALLRRPLFVRAGRSPLFSAVLHCQASCLSMQPVLLMLSTGLPSPIFGVSEHVMRIIL